MLFSRCKVRKQEFSLEVLNWSQLLGIQGAISVGHGTYESEFRREIWARVTNSVGVRCRWFSKPDELRD